MLSKTKIFLWILILSALTLRFITLGVYDFYDTTEARYAGIAMRILFKNDWLMPYIYPDVAFWGKPPLSFWLTALSFKSLGLNEFAGRLPHFLIMLLLVVYAYHTLKKLYDEKVAIISVLVYVTSLLFYVVAGSVMTEATLTFGVSLSLLSFWSSHLRKAKNSLDGYLFFIALAIAILAKGLAGLVLSLLPIFIYITVIKRKQWKEFFFKMPILKGILITILLALPWYILAEISYPGFLEYFIVGEHFNRFLIKGWSGDMYGEAHSQPMGIIWLFFIIATLPWNIYFAFLVLRKKVKLISDEFDYYLIICTLTPLVFFTFARNLLIPYTTTAILPFSILLARLIIKSGIRIKPLSSFAIISMLSISLALFMIQKFEFKVSSKPIIAKANEILAKNGEMDIYFYKMPLQFSTRFYSQDKIKQTDDLESKLGLFIMNEKYPEFDNCLEYKHRKEKLFFCIK